MAIQNKESSLNQASSLALLLGLILMGASTLTFAATSDWVYVEDDRLSYTSDPEGNRVPDFSHAGYGGQGFLSDGETLNIPDSSKMVVRSTLSPRGNKQDDAPQINLAIQAAHAAGGGVVALTEGVFTLLSPITLNVDNVVLRGHGPNKTFLKGEALFSDNESTYNQSIIIMGGGYVGKPWVMNEDEESYPAATIMTPFVPVSSRSFEVDSVDGFSVGDNVIVVHPSTEEWLTRTAWGQTIDDVPWNIAGAIYADDNQRTRLCFATHYSLRH